MMAVGGLAVAVFNCHSVNEGGKPDREWLIALADQLLDVYQGKPYSKTSDNLFLKVSYSLISYSRPASSKK